MIRIILSIIVSTLTFFIGLSSLCSASSYTPATALALTGSNSQTHFDVASILVSSSSSSGPILNTTSLSFSGTFYVKNIGWVMFATGSTYQVLLNCGGQPINHLTSKCTFSGIAWNENVGDIDFGAPGTTAAYNPGTGLLAGGVMSYAGWIDLTGIALPLRPVSLDTSSIVANHRATLTSTDGWIYDGGSGAWMVTITPTSETMSHSSLGGTNGVFDQVDGSLAANYLVDITDSNGSITRGVPLTINPDVPSMTLIGSSYFAESFCQSHTTSILCPDGTERSATTQTMAPSHTLPLYANGNDSYQTTIRARDIYGNRINRGSMRVTYSTTVRSIQASSYNGDVSNPGDASIFNSVFHNPLDASGKEVFDLPCLCGGDSTYTIQSITPTNTSNKIQLDSIIYVYNSLQIPLIGAGTPMSFVSGYETASSTTGPIYVGAESIFETTLTKKDPSLSVTPDLINILKMGSDGSAAEWQGLSSSPASLCTYVQSDPILPTDPLCDWSDGSIITIENIPPGLVTLHSTYAPLSDPVTPSTSSIDSYVHYDILGQEVLYPTGSKALEKAEVINMRYKIIGNSSQGLGTGAGARADIYNAIRQRIALASRNRTNTSYSDVNYLIVNGNYTLNDTTIWDTKRTIISLGGDIIINTNIPLRDSPLSLIALTDTAGNGGNIKIHQDVTDLHVSLLAERTLISETSDHQLYIHGTTVSSNELTPLPSMTCPYYISGTCIPSDYDLPGKRYEFSRLSDTTGKTSINTQIRTDYPKVPIVFEPESRLMQNPPPLMVK